MPLEILLRPLEGCPDLRAFIRGLPVDKPVVWLDSARAHPVTGRWSMLGCEPWLTFIAQGDRMTLHTSAATRVWRAHPLEALREVLRRYQAPEDLSIQGEELGAAGPAVGGASPVRTLFSHGAGRAVGLMGFLSYDLNRWIERLPAPHPSGLTLPEMAWFGMRLVILLDHVEQRGWLLGIVDPHGPRSLARRAAERLLDEAERLLHDAEARVSTAGDAGSVNVSPLAATSTQAEFETMVSRALEYIRAGEIFQANVSQRFTASWHGSSRALYEALREVNPSPFACFLSWNDLAVVSCSPERLVRVQDGRVETRPIAGTRPRGATPEEDAVNSLELVLSEKERAEHIMLVDLARNDLGRVCQAGSVHATELMTLEDYSHVIHIVSDISGALRPGIDAVEVIRAVFPGGTITGCPKVRCMEILRELEPVARGLYTGSLGYLAFDGTMDLNIAIRTMIIQGDRLSFHVGAGIVADSEPMREYHETLAKAGALMAALERAQANHDAPRHAR